MLDTCLFDAGLNHNLVCMCVTIHPQYSFFENGVLMLSDENWQSHYRLKSGDNLITTEGGAFCARQTL
ncbi:hypothetical protein XSR1_180088 [Xenorhabdus szentirmaii DSM 16338]|uniref:Uncharacterized protein n=1 Tax=Xenorhabdus szentirmaii DSM 16338 TaxID=1427518 RepID=W1IW59_9GAMM|nr:hypothetical protein XSR1_180088 [Xenorhabdus szentirmaii DSM 16338]